MHERMAVVLAGLQKEKGVGQPIWDIFSLQQRGSKVIESDEFREVVLVMLVSNIYFFIMTRQMVVVRI